MNKALKYVNCAQCLLGEAIQCPITPNTYEGVAYCFVHENIAHSNNFKPKACQNPKRVINAKHLVGKCALLGLSFFKELDKAKETYAFLNASTKGNFSLDNGKFLAAISFTKEDGFYDKESYNEETTHFNFFEFFDVIFSQKITNKIALL